MRLHRADAAAGRYQLLARSWCFFSKDSFFYSCWRGEHLGLYSKLDTSLNSRWAEREEREAMSAETDLTSYLGKASGKIGVQDLNL